MDSSNLKRSVRIVARYHVYIKLLPTGKDIWNLDQTLYANSFSFKAMNSHGFTAKNAGLESCFLMRKAFKGNNNR